jgi:hypothetical protein
LTITTFSSSDLEKIQHPFIHLLLPKLGLNRHTPRALIYRPQFRGGWGLVNLEKEQIVRHFESFQGHIRRNDDIGVSLRIQLSTQQLEIGSGALFLNTNPNLYMYSTTNTRLYYLWKQCYRYDITVMVNNMWEPSGTDTLNFTIMDFAVRDPKLAGQKNNLELINRCRLYLKVLWVRDLLQPDSEQLNWHLIRGLRQNDTHPLTFPYQGKPSQRAFTLWKEFIFRTFVVVTEENKGNLSYQLPLHAIPKASKLPSVKSPSDFDDIMAALEVDGDLRSKFNALPTRFKDIIGKITLPSDDGARLIHALRTGDALLASDGSYIQSLERGTHAYQMISKSDNKVHVEGFALSPNSNKMSSSLTEHYGAIAVLTILVVLLHHNKTSAKLWPDVILLIDNQEVVDRGDELWPSFMNVSKYLVHDFDLWMVMAELQRRLYLNIDFQWIRGHQTDESIANDPIHIQMNQAVDALATKAYALGDIPAERGAFLAGKVCFHQSGHHVQDVYDAIKSRESDDRLLEYYISKGWKRSNLALIDWRHLDKFLSTQSPIARCKILQSMHNWQNTGKQKLQFDNNMASNISSPLLNTKIDKCPMGCGCTKDAFHYM